MTLLEMFGSLGATLGVIAGVSIGVIFRFSFLATIGNAIICLALGLIENWDTQLNFGNQGAYWVSQLPAKSKHYQSNMLLLVTLR